LLLTTLSLSLSPTGVHTLRFAQRPTAVLIIKKPSQDIVSRDMLSLCTFLQDTLGYEIYAEPSVVDQEPQFQHLKKIDIRHPGKGVDFAITLGGDGTVLHYNSLFANTKGPVPPVVCFALGSLGFLTPFQWARHREILEVINQAHRKPVFVCARMRLMCKVFRAPAGGGVINANNNGLYNGETTSSNSSSSSSAQQPTSASSSQPQSLSPPLPSPVAMATAPTPVHIGHPAHVAGLPGQGSHVGAANALITLGGTETAVSGTSAPAPSPSPPLPAPAPLPVLHTTRQPLNELVIQRKLSSMALLQLFVDGVFVTTIRADGVIVSSPTGSTGYSMSAGGPMLAPSTPALVITPLCPHNLSFRPVVVCDQTVLRLTVSPEMDPRCPLIASFDGKLPVELYPGDSVQVTMSPVRVPSIVFTEFNNEWFKSIKFKLHWNVSVLDKDKRRDK
jgi:NAD+ kinase